MDPTIGRPSPSVQEVLANDVNPAPAVMLTESPAADQSTADLSIERYFSKEWHDREVEMVWRQCWQLACRIEEIPNVGDHVVYEIVHDSLIVVRTGPDEIRAYVNSCLHRGTLLRTEGGCVQRLRCPFHGWTWKLDGTLVHIPQQWDLGHVDPAAMALPEARVGTWGGYVFVNFAADGEPLETYLENLPEHFAAFDLENRYKAAHVAKIMPCNWKLAMEAFVEAYHVAVAHPQVLGYYGDSNTQYDVWPGVRHVSRMISVQGVPSPSMKGIAPERTIDEMRRDVPFFGGKPIEVGECETARAKLAERSREKISRSTQLDMSSLSDTESLDLIEYMLFPNMVPWGGQALPITYRFRPNGDDPESSIMEIMFLFSKSPDGSHPTPATMTMLTADQRWADAPELGSAAMVADQDTDNLMRIQKGLRTSRKPGVTLARYQESRIRHFHNTLDAYMSVDSGDGADRTMHTVSDFAVERLARPTDETADGNTIAVVDGQRTATFDDLDRAADQVANGLRTAGLGKGDRVAFVGRNCLACVELMLGAARAGVVMTVVNWRLHPVELSFVIGDCMPGLIVTTAEFAPIIEQLPEVAGSSLLVVDGGGPDDWDQWRDSQATDSLEAVPHADDDVVLQLYTSGTTGKPKGAMLTRRSLAACIPDTVAVWQLDRSSVMLSVLPMFHIAGAGTVVGSLWARSRVVIDNDPSAANMLRVIESNRVTNVVLASVMLQSLIESPAATTTDLSSIRTVSYGAAPITGQVLQSAIDALGCRIVQAYGLTETAGVLCVLGADDHLFDPNGPSDTVALALRRLRSCGRPRPGVELRIVDIHSGAELAAGEPGEVQARTARSMKGYWNRPEATAEVLLADGWFRTGDVGDLDADGYLFLRDRLKDTIISGGENIYPAEVEDALQWHPDVAEVAVIGVPDDRWGETPRAVVVRNPGSTLAPDELIAFARNRLAAYKCPTSVEFVETLPRNPTGKVLRRELREPHWAGRDRRIN